MGEGMFEKLAAYRRYCGLSQIDAAKEAGVSSGLICWAENGRYPRTIRKMKLLEEYYTKLERRVLEETGGNGAED